MPPSFQRFPEEALGCPADFEGVLSIGGDPGTETETSRLWAICKCMQKRHANQTCPEQPQLGKQPRSGRRDGSREEPIGSGPRAGAAGPSGFRDGRDGTPGHVTALPRDRPAPRCGSGGRHDGCAPGGRAAVRTRTRTQTRARAREAEAQEETRTRREQREASWAEALA